jgi:tetratricopeptide (TPR) repeat protein
MREKLVHIFLIAIFAALFYIDSFDNFFVWNDWTLIIENFLIKNWRHLPEIFTSAFWKPLIGEPPQIYRPLTLVSFMADFSLWHLNPGGYHLTNISLHVLNSLLVYFLMRVYVFPTVALMGSVLFAAHPIHSDAVTYISGRADLLMPFFLLSGTLLFLRSEKGRSWLLYAASLPLFLSALLAKETAAVFPLLLVAADITAFPSSWQSSPLRLLARQIGPFGILGLYFLSRKLFVGMSVSGYSLAPPDFFHHLFLVLKALPVYLGLILFPLNLHFIHSLEPQVDLQLWLSVVLMTAAGVGLRYAVRSGNRAVAFSLLWLWVSILSLIYPVMLGLSLIESWFYLASIGFFLLVALALDRLQFWSSSRVHILLALLVAVLLGGITLERNRDWRDEMRISTNTFSASPNDPVAIRLMGNTSMRYGRTLEAERIIRKGLLLAPDDPALHHSLAALYRFMERETEALAHYNKALEYSSQEPYIYWILGHYCLQREKLIEAERYFSAAVRIFPYSSELHHDLARAYFLQEKFDLAEAELRAALKISPYSSVLKQNLDTVLKRRGF